MENDLPRFSGPCSRDAMEKACFLWHKTSCDQRRGSPAGDDNSDQKLVPSLQHGRPPPVIVLSPAYTAGPAMAGFAIRTSFARHASVGPKAAHEPRFASDRPTGAD